MPVIEIVVVCSAEPAPPELGKASGDPQRAQNLLSSGFCWPHCVQNTLAIARCPFPRGRACGPTVNQRFRETRNLDGSERGVNQIDHTFPRMANGEPQVEPRSVIYVYEDSVSDR